MKNKLYKFPPDAKYCHQKKYSALSWLTGYKQDTLDLHTGPAQQTVLGETGEREKEEFLVHKK